MAAKTVHEAVRELCLAMPEAEEFVSHGAPNYRVKKGKIFAMFLVNHHGDGRVALWLPAPRGAQELHVSQEPKHYFVPPYVGPRGWLGVRLDQGISWKQLGVLVQQAYQTVAPVKLTAKLGKPLNVAAPAKGLNFAELDPLATPLAKRLLQTLRDVCLRLPETSESTQFGVPVWCAGKKTFAQFYEAKGELVASFWVGIDQQAMMTLDPRFYVPPFAGHNGWIALRLSRSTRPAELRALALASYRHFALQRMLKQLGE
jgi:predicted DNA-binding protein (MmcQ/YjbR family)